MSESRGGSSGLLSCEETGSWVCWGVAVCVSLAVGSGAYACFFFSEGLYRVILERGNISVVACRSCLADFRTTS